MPTISNFTMFDPPSSSLGGNGSDVCELSTTISGACILQRLHTRTFADVVDYTVSSQKDIGAKHVPRHVWSLTGSMGDLGRSAA